MIWFSLYLLSLAILSNFAEADEGEKHLLYAVESQKDKPIMFYFIDFDLTKPKYFLNLTNSDKKTLENIFLGELHVFLSFKDSNVVGRYDILEDKYDEKSIGNVQDASLVGIGPNDVLFMYVRKDKRFTVYDFSNETYKMELKKLTEANEDMKSIDVDPRDRWYIFYAYCNKKDYFGKVFDAAGDQLFPNYNQKLSACYDMWRITPNGEQVYAVKGKKIFFSPVEARPFYDYYTASAGITTFAVGNKELFFTSGKGRKIMKVVNVNDKGQKDSKELKVSGTVLAMTLSEPSELDTIPVVETEN